MGSQKYLITTKKGVNKIENQGEKWYKLLQKCQMTDFCENIPTLGQIISGTICDRDKQIFLQKEGVNKIKLGIQKDPMGSDMSKTGVNRVEVPTIFKYGSAPPQGS